MIAEFDFTMRALQFEREALASGDIQSADKARRDRLAEIQRLKYKCDTPEAFIDLLERLGERNDAMRRELLK